MKHSVYILMTLVLLLVACKPKVPKEYIQPGDMEDILYDYHIAQAMAKADQGEKTSFDRNKYYLAVLKKHGVTRAEFDSSLVYYYSHLERLKAIYSEVSERLSDDAKMLGTSVGEIGRYSQYSSTGDTANIWTGRTELLLLPKPALNRYDFSVKVDTAFRKGDSFMFQFMAEYIWQSGSKDAVVCIVTKDVRDSVIQTVNHVSVSGLTQVRVPANRDQKLKEVSGFIYLTNGGNDDATARQMMFIDQIHFIRFHEKEADNERKAANNQADSLQRAGNPGRPPFVTPRGGNPGGMRVRPVPPPPGNSRNRVGSGQHRPGGRP